MNGPASGAVRVAAQAKINLYLRILAREARGYPNGYHQIETLFCRLTLADHVTVRLTAGASSLSCYGAEVGPPEKNLAWRALLAYQAIRAGWPGGAMIEIEKHIPVGAGLGGGSADAGAVLRALRALDPEPPSSSALLAAAQSLGADVPFLTLDSPYALAWGRGERLLPLSALPSRAVHLVVPPVSVATGPAYQWFAAAHGKHDPPATVLDLEALTHWDQIIPQMVNDFESVVAERVPPVAKILDTLRTAPAVEHAMMSGSGSAVFVLLIGNIKHVTPEIQNLQHQLPGTRIIATSTASHVVPPERLE